MKRHGFRAYYLLIAILLNSAVFSSEKTELKATTSCFTQISGLSRYSGMDEILRIFFSTNKKNDETYNKYLDILSSSRPFKRWLDSLGIDIDELSFEKFVLVIADYLDTVLSRFRDASFLLKNQDDDLLKMLRQHGAQNKEGESGYELLRRVSRLNLERELDRIHYTHSVEMEEARRVVEDIELFIVHNSHHMYQRPHYPILSPASLNEIGLEGFAFSSDAFNEFIHSTDHVYFFPRFKRIGDNFPIIKSEYGDGGVISKREYAKQRSFFSPFIMYPSDLYLALQSHNDELAETFLKSQGIITRDINGSLSSSFGHELDARDKEAVVKALSSLHHYNFNFEDFETLVKTALLKELEELYLQNNDDYDELLEILVHGDYEELRVAISRIINKKFRIRFEGRIPFAVPDTELVHFPSMSE